jgi:hypothetical protein
MPFINLKELAGFTDHCQEFFPDENFSRNHFLEMMLQSVALMMAETIANAEKYGASTTIDDVEKTSKNFPPLVEHYMTVINRLRKAAD